LKRKSISLVYGFDAFDEDGEWAILNDRTVGPFRRIWNDHPVLLTVSAAFLVRLFVVMFVFRDQTDPASNHAQFGWEMGWVARSIVQGHGFSSPFFPATGPTGLVPPIFPYLIAGIFHVFGLYTTKAAFAVLSINSLLSALTCIPIYFSTRYALGERVATLASWGWVFYPYAIYFSAARVWDYALTGLLFTTCFCVAQRLHDQNRLIAWSGFGLLYGVAMLANPSVLPMFPVFLLLAVIQRRRAGGRWLLHGFVAALGALAILTPWTIHNYRTLHVVRPVRDNFWMECWAGNNGDTFESNAKWAHPASSEVEMKRFLSVGEIPYLAEKQALATNFIRQHPRFFVAVSLRRVFCYWTGFWSFAPAYLQQEPLQNADIFFCTSMTVLMLIGAFSFWRRDRSTALPYLVLIALFPLTYYVTHASPDYRQPIEPEIIVLAVMGTQFVRRRLSSDAIPNQDVEDEVNRLSEATTV
jgi:4-amino-4-deoxy-L-arabinose transferase-like glycosyltransferase